MTERDPRRAHAGALWAFRANAELEASARFARIAAALADNGARTNIIELARTAASDELRHHGLCARLAEHFGTAAPPRRTLMAPPLRATGGDARRQTLYETIAMGCVTETLSVALLMEMREVATDDRVGSTVAEILRDEVHHSRLGWGHLAAEHRHIELSFLGPRLPAMLAATVHEEVFAGPDSSSPTSRREFATGETGGNDSPGDPGLGGLHRARRMAIVVEALTDVVFPGLARFGVDTAPAHLWLEQRVEARVITAA